MPALHRKYANSLDNTIVRELLGPSVRLVKLADVMPAWDSEVRRYYEGAPLTWNVIAAQGDVERDLCEALIDKFSTITNRTAMLCLSGEPGSGKSTLAWRVAAEIGQITGQLLFQILDNEDEEIWYKLEAFLQEYEGPLIVLIDDVFRNDEASRALTSLRPDLNLTIIATSRSNEIPDDLRLPFQMQFEDLEIPTLNEKIRVLQRLELNERTLDTARRKRLQNANSWLVMMMEVTTGKELAKIVHNSVKRLKMQDEVVYRAYEYLCFAGQYDLAVPESLIAELDSHGYFYNLLEHPVGKGLIFGDSNRVNMLRTQHPTIAREALKAYRRDPLPLVRDFISAIQPDQRMHRVFIKELFRRLVSDKQLSLMQKSLEFKAKEVEAVIAASGNSELIHWATLYRLLNEQEKEKELQKIVLNKIPQTSEDWSSQIPFVEQKGTQEQLAALINTTAAWLTTNPQDSHVRALYLGFVERHGTAEQLAVLINTTAAWLATNPQASTVRVAYLRVVERHGTAEQLAALIDATAAWLAANPHDNFVRAAYLRVVERHGTAEQLAALIDATAAWLAANPHDSHVRALYLGFVERHGTAEQLAVLIDATAAWLAANPHDSHVRAAYLRVVERHGTPEQLAALIDATAAWLAANPHDNFVRAAYLRVVKRHGTPEQLAALIDATASNSQDSQIRAAYLRAVERHGTPEQLAALIDATAAWLAANPHDIEVRIIYWELVRHKGTPKQVATAIDAATHWLATTPQNVFVRMPYLRLVEYKGVPEQITAAIDTAARWLVSNPDDFEVRKSYLKLIELQGTQQHIASAIDATADWLVSNPGDIEVRKSYLKLIERQGTQQHIASVIDATADWLVSNPDDFEARVAYLGLVERQGTQQQITIAIDTTANWLVANPQDAQVRQIYLKLVERQGVPEKIAVVIDATTSWLFANSQDINVRRVYLGLVKRQGTSEQLQQAYNLAKYWLDRNPETRDTWIIEGYGQILFRLERYQEAESQFRRVLFIKPSYVPSRFSLAWSLYHQKKTKEAYNELRYAKRWAEKGKDYPLGGALNQLGHYHLLEGDLEQAIRYFQEAIRADPSHYNNYWELGQVLLIQRRYDLALIALKATQKYLPVDTSEKYRSDLKELIEVTRSKMSGMASKFQKDDPN